MKPGILYLIPTPLGDSGEELMQFPGNKDIIDSLEVFIVEELRTARRFLKKSGISRTIDSLTFFELNEHTVQEESELFLNPALEGKNIGLLSEAGLPCIADPGHSIVKLAHKKGMRVIPLVGPSSLMLALMASGMNGQQFIFHGYLPAKPNERVSALRSIEKDIHTHHRTQIFIEAPYRNQAMLESIRSSCHGDTRLCIAIDLTMESEYISTRSVAGWKNNLPDLHKRPAVFLLGE
jgi:16S rRNA (cytidine1402-2'-O)-methyltransferase